MWHVPHTGYSADGLPLTGAVGAPAQLDSVAGGPSGYSPRTAACGNEPLRGENCTPPVVASRSANRDMSYGVRAGAALVVALATLAVLATLMTVILHQMTARRKLLSVQHAALQADWLARSGIQYAIARLLAEPEPFTADLNQLATDCRLRVCVEPAGEQPLTFRISSVATALPDTAAPVRREARCLIRLAEFDGGRSVASMSEQ